MIAPQFLRANPRLRGRGVPYIYGIGGPSAFEALYAQATVVGSSALPLTNTSSGNRKSVFSGGDVRATLLLGNTNWYQSGDASLYWYRDNSAVVGTNVDANIVRIQTGTPGAGPQRKVWAHEPGTNATYTFSIQVKQDVGSSQSGYIAIVNDASDTIKAQTNFTATGNWQTVTVTGTTDGGGAGVRFNIYGADNTDILYRGPVTTNTATPVSAFPDGSGAGFTKVDQVTVNGIFVESSLKGDELQFNSDLTTWGANASAVDSGGYFTVTSAPSGSFPGLLRTGEVGSVEVRTFTYTLKAGTNPYAGFRAGTSYISAGRLPSVDLSDGSVSTNTVTGLTISSRDLGAGWWSVSITTDGLVLSGDTMDIVVCDSDGMEAALTHGKTILVKDPRAVKSSAPAAGFTDDSPAGTDYAKDGLTFVHTYTASASIQFTIMPYGWSDDGNPDDAECVLFESGAFRLKLTAAGFIEIDGTAVSTKKLTANTLSVASVKYDGVNHTLQVDGETPVVAASAIIPSGTSYVGDAAAGGKSSHSIQHIAIYDDKNMTAAEITTGEDGYQARIGSIVPV